MTVPFQDYFDKAELSLAAYSDFSGIARTGSGALDFNVVKSRLATIPPGKTVSDFSATEASKFVERFDVLDQYTADPILNGFSATLFRDKVSGQLFFVNRGTDDILSDGLLTDAVLALGGKPMMQIVTMVNYYLRLKAGAGSVAQQVEFDPLAGSFRAATSVTGVGAGISNANVVVAGHSLGGYLSTIFGYLFGATTTSIFTYNAPGSWGVEATIRNLAVLLGNANPTYSSDRQTNLIGDYLVSAVPGHQGTDLRIFEEGNSHSQKVLTDSLAIYNLFAKLDQNLTPSEIDTILKASTASDADSLEQVLDAVRKVILGTGISSTKVMGTADTQTTREAFYANLYNLQGNSAFKTLAGKGNIESLSSSGADTLVTLAKTSPDALAYRYALKEGNPFALLGAEYTKFNTAGELDLYDKTTGQGELTEAYLKDRAAFLAGVVDANTHDTGTGKALTVDISSVRGHDYEDKASGLTLREINTLSVETNLKIAFGGSGNDTLWGSDLADHLYGGAGSDRLDGGKGDDYIEGNAGADNFTGGAGNDTLLGGAGLDIYTINDGEGWDTLEDSDGQGAVYYGSQQLTGGDAVGDSGMVWQQKAGDKTYTYILTDWSEGGETYKRLSIQGPDGGVFIKRWQAGQLGIELKGVTPTKPTLPTTTAQYIGDQTPDKPNDRLYGSSNNDLMQGLAGEDTLEGGDGDDRLQGGDMTDILYGGIGNDILEGQGTAGAKAGYSDELFGAEGDDTLWADQIRPMAEIYADNDKEVAAPPYQSSAVLDGGSGKNQLIGAWGNDQLYGGTGQDLLIGMAGGDVLFGDLDLLQAHGWGDNSAWLYTLEAAFNTLDETAVGDADILLGGAGADWMAGGGGNDLLDGGSGADVAKGGAGGDIVFGRAGNDTLFGDNLALSLASKNGDDWLDGGEGNDSLWGDGGSDQLLGGAGNDEIHGDNNTLPGENHGNDMLYGGEGMSDIVNFKPRQIFPTLFHSVVREFPLRQKTQRRIPLFGGSSVERQNPGRQPVVGGIEVGCRNPQQNRQPFDKREGRRMFPALVTADTGTGRRLVQTGQHAETILGNTTGKTRFTQALAEDRGWGFERGRHSSIFVDTVCTVSTDCVESTKNAFGIIERAVNVFDIVCASVHHAENQSWRKAA